jgi:hypothetical protein
MSEQVKKEGTSKSLEQLQSEYTQLAAKAGHTQFQIWGLESELEVVNKLLRDLNLEAAKLSAEAKEKV